MRTDYLVSDGEKREWECIEDLLQELAFIYGAAAFVPGLGTIAGPAALGFAWLAYEIDDVVDDPPQPAYKATVRKPRLSAKFPSLRARPRKLLVGAAKTAVQITPSIAAFVQSAERGQGADHAGDRNFMLKHSKGSRLFRRETLSGLYKLELAIRAAATALKGSADDVKLKHEDYKRFRSRLKKRMPTVLSQAARDMSLPSETLKGIKKKLGSIYIKKMWSTRLSYMLLVTANVLKRRKANIRALTQ